MNAPDPQKQYLCIDACSPTLFVGLWQNGAWLAHASSDEQALEGIFSLCTHVLEKAGCPLSRIEGFFHAEGPGSILGIRLAAMAIQTWKALPEWRDAHIYGYRSLPVAGACLAAASAGIETPFHVISEGRQKAWNCWSSNHPERIEILETNAIPAPPQAVYYLTQRKGWNKAPEHAIPFKPDPGKHPGVLAMPGILTLRQEPEIFNAAANAYQKWTPERHR